MEKTNMSRMDKIEEALAELLRSQKELTASQKELTASQKKTDRQLQEMRDRLQASHEETEKLIQTLSAKTDKRIETLSAKTDRKLQETRDLIETLSAKTDRKLQETRGLIETLSAKTDQQIREVAAQLKETDRDFNGKWGAFIEALVEGELISLLRDRDIAVKTMLPNTQGFGDNGETLCEFDIIAVNGKEVVVVEVKTTLTVKKINEFIAKLSTFKQWFPEYSDRKVYGAVAFIRKYEHSDIYAQRKRLLAIRAVGKGGTILNDSGFKLREF